jgi:putative pyruvate formate lyase activating enzyme
MVRQVGKPKFFERTPPHSDEKGEGIAPATPLPAETNNNSPQNNKNTAKSSQYSPHNASKNIEDGKMLARGVMVRHLVLPSHRDDSIAALHLLDSRIGADNILLSLMSQYTPDFYLKNAENQGKFTTHSPLARKITSFEYNSVLKTAQEIGFDGFLQGVSSASKLYTPEF